MIYKVIEYFLSIAIGNLDDMNTLDTREHVLMSNISTYMYNLFFNQNQTAVGFSSKINETTITDGMENFIGFRTFNENFREFHGMGGFIISVLGVTASVIIVTVLTTKKLWNHTNLLLAAIAVMDMLTMISYIPFLTRFYVLHEAMTPSYRSYGWTLFKSAAYNFTATAHLMSVWTSVVLVVIRHIQVRQSLKQSVNKLSLMKWSKIGLVAAVNLPIVIMIPTYCSSSISVTQIGNETVYMATVADDKSQLVMIAYCTYAVLGKILPCVMMFIFGLSIVHLMVSRMYTMQRRWNKRPHAGEMAATKIMLAIMMTFVVSELPQGVLILLAIGNPEFVYVYELTGDLQDFVTIIVSSLNFILYCFMSKKFRCEFSRIYCRARCLHT